MLNVIIYCCKESELLGLPLSIICVPTISSFLLILRVFSGLPSSFYSIRQVLYWNKLLYVVQCNMALDE